MIKTPSFVNEITYFLRQELECESPTPQGDAAPIPPSSGTPSVSGQGVTQRFFCHLCWGILLSWAEILPCTEVAANDKFQQKIMFVASQCFVEQNISGWAILHLLLPPHCPALHSSGSAEGNVGRQLILSSFPVATWPIGACTDSKSCILLSSHAAVKKPQDVNFLVEFPAKNLGGCTPAVLCCLRVSS